MAEMMICYDFNFNVDVKKRNGKTYKRHLIKGLGLNFNSALWDIYFKLKKRKTEIITINSVIPCRVAFAYRGEETLKIQLADYPPEIPTDFSEALKNLPQKPAP